MHPVETVLLSTAYFPPVQYVAKFLNHKVTIEKHEHYSKQSYRNRFVIGSANGPLTLVVPVEKTHNQKMLITHVKIDYGTPWQRTHLRAVQAAYKSSPFFEFYMDEFEPFFLKKYNYLFDLNIDIIHSVQNILGLYDDIAFTTAYIPGPLHCFDMRDSIHPKARMQLPDKSFECVGYNQVFKDKQGFIPNLSVIDLIFNEGPEAKKVLEMCVK